MSDEAMAVTGTGLPADGDDRDSDVRVLRGAGHPVLDDLASDREVDDEDDSPEWDVEEYARQQYRDCWGDEPSDNRVEWLQQQMNTLWTGQRLLDHSAHKALESLQWHEEALNAVSALLDLQKSEISDLYKELDWLHEDLKVDMKIWNRRRWLSMVAEVAIYALFLVVLYLIK